MNAVTLLYNSILSGEREPSSLSDSEKDALFSYLCGELEKGQSVDNEILHICALTSSTPLPPARETVIEKTYQKIASLYGMKRRIRGKRIVRRALAAAVAVCSFIVFTLVTASAFGLDFVEHIKTLFHEEESVTEQIHYVFFESPDKPMKKYESVDALFSSEMRDYYYPSHLPEGTTPFSVTEERDGKTFFTYRLKDDLNKSWIITALPAEDAYLPMGYKYETMTADRQCLAFVYTLSRNNGGITQYTVYTVLDGVMYKLILPTGDWDAVKSILDSFKKAD